MIRSGENERKERRGRSGSHDGSSPDRFREQGFLSGRNAVREALTGDTGRFHRLLISKSVAEPFARELRASAASSGVPVQAVPPQKLDRLVPGVNHQGVALVVSAVPFVTVHDLLTSIAPTMDEVQRKKPILLILDRIQDPFNLGAILRSAAAAGAAAVILSEKSSAPVNAAAMKTSAGAAGRIPIARASSLRDLLQELKERGYWIVGADGAGDQSLWELDWDRAIAIVIGSEEKGMSKGVAAECDFRAAIPLSNDVESLNASVAAGIFLFAASRARV